MNIPARVAVVLVGVFLIIQIIGELLQFKGKVVPEFLKVRKYFTRKKEEKETIAEVRKALAEFNQHYSTDNICMRNEWMAFVNKKIQEGDQLIKQLSDKLDKNNADTLSLLIDSKRNTIINFAAVVVDKSSQVTRQQFNRVLKLYEEYEQIIHDNGLTNGEVDIAYRIINQSYEEHMRNHTFVEDVLGYNK